MVQLSFTFGAVFRNRKLKILLEGFCQKKPDRKLNKCYIGEVLEEVDVRER